MKVAAVTSDLMLYSRIDAAGSAAGASMVRASSPAELPAGLDLDLDLILVDWSERDPSWTDVLRAIRATGSRVILYGRHTDVEAHRAARDAGLGPMWARSKLVAELPTLVVPKRT